MIRRLSLVFLGIPCLCAVLVANASAQSAPAGSLQLTAVEVSGTKRYTQADVLRLSGLRQGRP